MARTINEITEAMRVRGGESSQWQAYCEDCYKHYGVVPYADTAQDLPVDDDFAGYWLAVSERDYSTARDYGDVADEWIEALGEPDCDMDSYDPHGTRSETCELCALAGVETAADRQVWLHRPMQTARCRPVAICAWCYEQGARSNGGEHPDCEHCAG